MLSVKEGRGAVSRLILTITVVCIMAALPVSSEAMNGTEDALQAGPQEYSQPEFVTQEFVTREDVRDEIRTMVGPVIESLIEETSAAIKKLQMEIDKLKEEIDRQETPR